VSPELKEWNLKDWKIVNVADVTIDPDVKGEAALVGEIPGEKHVTELLAIFPALPIAAGEADHKRIERIRNLIALAPRMLRAIISMVGQGERGDFIGRTSPNVNSLNTEGEKGIRLAIEILNEIDPGGAL